MLGLLVPEALIIRLCETEAGSIDGSAIDELGCRLDAADAVGPGMDENGATLTSAILADPARPPLVLDAANSLFAPPLTKIVAAAATHGMTTYD